jgi:hypothetical protein
MAQQEQRGTSTAAGIDLAASSVSTASKNLQAFATEIAEMSKESFDHATQALEKLRNARSMDEVVSIQTSFLKEAFEHSAQRTRRFSELVTAFPLEFTKTYQDTLAKCVNAAIQSTEAAGQAAAAQAERFTDAVRKG